MNHWKHEQLDHSINWIYNDLILHQREKKRSNWYLDEEEPLPSLSFLDGAVAAKGAPTIIKIDASIDLQVELFELLRQLIKDFLFFIIYKNL